MIERKVHYTYNVPGNETDGKAGKQGLTINNINYHSYFQTHILFSVIQAGIEPATHSLEDCCSIP